MDSTTPRFAGLRLRFVDSLLRSSPLPRLLSRLVVERKLRELDFAKEGEPAPFYMPTPFQRKHR